MKKSDDALRQTTVAAIKRHAMRPYKWHYTRFYEAELLHNLELPDTEVCPEDDELPIASVLQSENDWSLVTTRRAIGMNAGKKIQLNLKDLEDYNWGIFKDTKTRTALMKLRTINGEIFELLYETGAASMVMIYAIKTLLRIVKRNK